MTDQRAADFYNHAVELSRQAGVELDDGQLEELLEASNAGGFDWQATERAFAAIVERDFERADDAGPYDEDEADALDYEADEEDVEVADEDGIDPRLIADLEHGRGQVEARIGRKLTAAETATFLQTAMDSLRSGHEFHGSAAFQSAGEGAKSTTDMTSAELRRHMDTRLAEMNPEPDPDLDRAYDPDRDEDRIEYMRLRMAGYPAEEEAA